MKNIIRYGDIRNNVGNVLFRFDGGNLYLIGGRPGTGKTALTVRLAIDMAIDNKSVLYFTLEQSKEQLAKIFDLDRLSKILAKSRLFICDTSGVSIHDIRSKVSDLKYQHGLDIVIIDYVQLMRGNNPMDRKLEANEISKQLKILSKEFNIDVIVNCQLSKAVENRAFKIPELSDIIDFDYLVNEADVVGLLYRDNVENDNKAVLKIVKSKDTGTGNIILYYNPNTRAYSIPFIFDF